MIEETLTALQEQYASDYSQKVLEELGDLGPLQATAIILYIQSNFIYNLGGECKYKRAKLVNEIANACHASFSKWDLEDDPQ
jgi:hypothetical protein